MNRRTLFGIGAIALAALACGACNNSLTPDGTPYTFTNPSPGTVVVTAASTSGNNNRQLFWSQTSPVEADSTACATFTSGQGIDQQGIALRINNGQALELERNIYDDVFNAFVFVDWTGDGNFTIFGTTTNVPNLAVDPALYPLNVCAQITGSTMQFVEWQSGQPQPSWATPTGTATVPATAPALGQAGFYVGHVVPGTSTTFSNLTVDGEVPVNPI